MVSDSSPDGERSGNNNRSGTPITYTEYFEALCPIYIAYGMTYEQFWFGDPWIARSYREAYVERRKEENTRDWLQGAYIYNAVSTALANAFRKKGTKTVDYLEEPFRIFPLTKEEAIPLFEPVMITYLPIFYSTLTNLESIRTKSYPSHITPISIARPIGVILSIPVNLYFITTSLISSGFNPNHVIV